MIIDFWVQNNMSHRLKKNWTHSYRYVTNGCYTDNVNIKKIEAVRSSIVI
jgi:hypothetical protein